VPYLIALAVMAATTGATRLLVIDLAEVNFIDGAGCPALETIREICEEHGAHVGLQGVSARTLRILTLAKIGPQLLTEDDSADPPGDARPQC